MSERKGIIIVSILSMLLLFAANLFFGAVRIPLRSVMEVLMGGAGDHASWHHIIIQSRIPQAITALFAGASLAVSGLMLQTLFRNPLAGPSILGISDGANLGVAAVMLASGGTLGSLVNFQFGGYLLIVIAAFVGAMVVMSIIIFFSTKVNSNVMLLIIGIMVGYVASAAISILNFYASADKVHAYVMWGLGNFSGVSLQRVPFYVLFCSLGLFSALMLIKPLNALLLGELYAKNLGINVKLSRVAILVSTGILTATVTAFCGPISFIGLAVPHLARLLLGSSNHTKLLPVTLLTGASVALLCNLITVLPPNGSVLPLNAVTSFIGAPVIIYVIINKRNIHYFN